jgi:hypothetical protein
MKKIFLILIAAIFLGFVSFYVFQYFFGAGVAKGALQVTSSPESKVYLGDKYLGTTPLCKCDTQDMQKAGDYTIRLVPRDNSLLEFQEKINITEGVLTVVDRKFGKDSLSEGAVISLTPLTDKNKSELLVVSIPSKSEIFLDNNKIGETPFLFNNPTESDHALTVTKEGYREKNIRIRTPLGYKLTVTLYLSTSDAPNQASSSAEVSVTPTPTQIVSKVVILQTPTGFLRVRSSASIGSAEIARVAPPDVYELVSEQIGWYQIKLKDGTLGWISSQYAAKQ